MSVRIQQGAGLEAQYVEALTQPDGFPLSITCWLYFDSDDRPQPNDIWTLWWFGEVGAAGDNYLALQARRGTTGVKLLVTAKAGGSTLSAEIDDVPIGPDPSGVAGRGWHCVSVVIHSSLSNPRLLLYVDDEPADTDTGANGLDPTAWDRFTVGRSLVGSPSELEAFYIEQVAIWQGALGTGGGGASDNARMYAERIPPKDAEVAGLGIDAAPDFSYWYLAPHSRGGIPATEDRKFRNLNNGGLANAAPDVPPPAPGREPIPRPILGWDASMYGTPRWSAHTPVLFYTVDQPIDPIARPPAIEPSRLQPNFFFVGSPQEESPVRDRCDTPGYPNADLRAISYYRDPNMSQILKVDFRSANQLEPPYTDDDGDTRDYFPQKDLSLVAKRLADEFALQSFTAGRGTGPGKRYAGAVQMRGPGDGGLRGGALQGLLGTAASTGSVTFPGSPDSIPLELNYADRVTPDGVIQEPWSTWYRASGHAYLKPWMDHFWAALKQELDARDLCYPLRIHLDYEGWVRDTSQLRINNSLQIGAWPAVVADGRKSTEVLFKDINPSTGVERTRTLDQLLTDDPPPTRDDTKNFYDDENDDFAQWWWKYEYACRTWAVYQAQLATVKDYFPYTLIGDYAKYPCDNPGYQDVNQLPPRAFNTAGNASFPLDFGTPVLYTNNNWVDNVRGAYDGRVGYTIVESIRDVTTMRIDAVANARVKTRLAPTFEDATRLLGYGARDDNPEYCAVPDVWQYFRELTKEDQQYVMEYGWRRGATDFILFSFRTWYGEGNASMFETKIDACRWLRDSVHSCAQHDQARTGRTARVGWRSM